MFGNYLSIAEDKAVEKSLAILIPATRWCGCRCWRFIGHIFLKTDLVNQG